MIKKKYLLILYIPFIIILFGCIGKRAHPQSNKSDACIESELYKFLTKEADRFPHIANLEGVHVDTCFYYSYFFQVGGDHYVTLWRNATSSFYGVLEVENPKEIFKYSWLKVSPYYFILITQQSSEFEQLISSCEGCLRDMADLPQHYDIIDDGPLFARTYKITDNNGYHDFERQESYIIDFLGDEWVEWELTKMDMITRDYPDAIW